MSDFDTILQRMGEAVREAKRTGKTPHRFMLSPRVLETLTVNGEPPTGCHCVLIEVHDEWSWGWMLRATDGSYVNSLPLLLTFAQAEQIGQDLHDQWIKVHGTAPMERDDMGWPDVVQYVVRRAREVADGR